MPFALKYITNSIILLLFAICSNLLYAQAEDDMRFKNYKISLESAIIKNEPIEMLYLKLEDSIQILDRDAAVQKNLKQELGDFMIEKALSTYLNSGKNPIINAIGKNVEFDRLFLKYLLTNFEQKVAKQDLRHSDQKKNFAGAIFSALKDRKDPISEYYQYLIKLVLGYMNISEYSDFKNYYEEIIKLAEKIDPIHLQHSIYRHYLDYANYLYGLERDLELSELYFNKATAHLATAQRAYALLMLVKIYNDKKDREMALETCLELLSMEDSLNIISKIQLNQSLSGIYIDKAEFKKAELFYKKSETLISEFEKKESDNGFINNLKNEGLSLKLSIAHHLGLKQEISADEIFINAEMMGYAQFRYLEAAIKILAENGQFDQLELLEKKLRRSTGLFRKTLWEAGVYAAFAETYNKRGKYEMALERIDSAFHYISATDNQEFLTAAISDKNLGLKVLKEKLKAQFAIMQQDSSKISLEDIRITAMHTTALMDLIRQQTVTKGAKELLLNEAPELFERAIYISNQLYKKTADPLYIEECFSYAEKSKAVLLLDALKETEARRFGDIPDSLLSKEMSLNSDISYYTAEKIRAEAAFDSVKTARYSSYLFQKRAELNNIKQKLEKNYPKYYELKYSADVCDIKTFQKGLKNFKIEALEYFMGDSTLYIFKISADSLKLYALDLPKNFSKDFDDYYKVLTDVNSLKSNSTGIFKALNSLGHEFYNLLIGSVYEAELPKSLLIIPDAVLSYLPFEALVKNNQEGSIVNFAKTDYLLKYSAISYAYSATLWLENIRKEGYRGGNSKILAMTSDYSYKAGKSPDEWDILRSKLKPLSGAEEEVLSLKQKFSGNFLLNASAVESEFKTNAANYSVLHLAMHGVIDEHNSAHSGLFFTDTDDSNNDNILFAYEIPSLNIAAEMVVLSACQTGYGKYQRGEGVISLGRSFMYAGAKSVVMTLWEVNDQSGKKLMELFYSNLDKGMSKDRALAKAKIDFLENAEGLYAHPYFWSNFVLIGDPAPISIKKALRKSTVNIYLIGLIVTVLLAALLFLLGRKKAEPVDSAA